MEQETVNTPLTPLRGTRNIRLTRLLVRLMRIGRLREMFSSDNRRHRPEFISELLDKLEITFQVSDDDLCRIPRTGPFIVLANHPFGGLDDLILLSIFSGKRPDFKIFANSTLKKFGGLDDYFLPGTMFSSLRRRNISQEQRQTISQHLQNGGSLGIFPAGKPSGYDLNSNDITDPEWIRQVMLFVRRTRVPIVPVYFQNNTTLFGHVLGMVHPLLQTFGLSSEPLNKKKSPVVVRIGNPIPVRDLDEFHDIARYSRYLRARTYALGTTLEVRKFFTTASTIDTPPEEIIPAQPVDELQKEIDGLGPEHLLFSQAPFKVYCSPVSNIPVTITELGRLREITFREVGEGTNKKIDLDEYDLYYRHLFIWDEDARRIVGAYRIGMGAEIIKEYGLKGFYIDSLYRIGDGLHPVLNSAMELGRSFIVQDYQKKPLSLYCLWKGILYFLLKHPEYRYLTGPVSISNRFSHFSRSLMIEYITQKHFDHDLARYVIPRNAFRVNTSGVDVEILLEASKDLKKLDKQIRDVNMEDMGLPVLLKKYLGLNGRIVAFNLDPLFNDALDGLLILDLLNIPLPVITSLSKEIQDESILERFSHEIQPECQ